MNLFTYLIVLSTHITPTTIIAIATMTATETIKIMIMPEKVNIIIINLLIRTFIWLISYPLHRVMSYMTYTTPVICTLSYLLQYR